MKLVDSEPELEQAIRALSGARTFYVDTEFESTREGTTLCVLQLSAGGELYIIDALALRDLAPLRGLLAEPEAEWVLHAGQQDLPLINSRLSLSQTPPIFDTQIAWALLGPEHSVSLSYLVYRVLGIRTGKSHQTDDWVRRPLPAAQLAYAAADIEHLPAIHRALGARLDALDRRTAVHAASAELIWPSAEPPGLLSLESFRNAWQLDRHGQAALRFIIDWYNALDTPTRGTIPEPKTLLAIAGRLPKTAAELGRIKGVPRRFASERGERFVTELMRATARADAADFVEIEPAPYTSFDELRLDGWLAYARAEVSAELGVAAELAFPGRVVRRMRAAITRSGQRVSGAEALTGWRQALLVESYLAFCRRQA
jgi:ribonuclease D